MNFFEKGKSSSIIFQNRDVFGFKPVSFSGSILNPKLSQIHLEVDVSLLSKEKTSFTTWVFPKMVVPQNEWFIFLENPTKMDDLGVTLFLETPTSTLL